MDVKAIAGEDRKERQARVKLRGGKGVNVIAKQPLRLARQYVYGNYVDEVLLMRVYKPVRGGQGRGSASAAFTQRADVRGQVRGAQGKQGGGVKSKGTSRTYRDYCYLQDAQYNVSAVTDSRGRILERYAYTPYGEVRVLDRRGKPFPQNRSRIGNVYYFTGRRLDPESGLYYFRNRYYAPVLGRFVSRDPAEVVSVFNNTYGWYNVVNTLDPDGAYVRGATVKYVHGPIPPSIREKISVRLRDKVIAITYPKVNRKMGKCKLCFGLFFWYGCRYRFSDESELEIVVYMPSSKYEFHEDVHVGHYKEAWERYRQVANAVEGVCWYSKRCCEAERKWLDSWRDRWMSWAFLRGEEFHRKIGQEDFVGMATLWYRGAVEDELYERENAGRLCMGR